MERGLNPCQNGYTSCGKLNRRKVAARYISANQFIMRRVLFAIFAGALLVSASVSAGAAALGSSTRSVIPSEVQQIISVDYRQVLNSQTATELHDRVLPDNLKQFENALKGVGIDPQRDIDQLTFAAFREKSELRMVGVAQGEFSLKKVFTRLKTRKIAPTKFHTSLIYPMGNGMNMSLLDDSTMLFGDPTAVKSALSARDGDIQSLNSNSDILDLMPAVDSGAVWSVLDSKGTQTMMSSAMGDVAGLAEYQTLSKRLLSSRYAMNFGSGVNFDLDVITSDNMTATTLSTLARAGVMFKKTQATGVEKMALDNMTVDSDSNQLKFHFKSDEKQFQSLINSDLFAAMIR